MSAKNKPLSRKDGLVVQELNGETLIYDLTTNKALCLNETSALIWAACDGSRDVSDLSEYATEKLKARVNDDLVWLALDQLKQENMLLEAPDLPKHIAGESRRSALKKLGLASAVVLPMVAGIIAPPAISAASACVPVTGGCTCTASGTNGSLCTAATPCASPACRCFHANGGNTQGNCAP